MGWLKGGGGLEKKNTSKTISDINMKFLINIELYKKMMILIPKKSE